MDSTLMFWIFKVLLATLNSLTSGLLDILIPSTDEFQIAAI